MKIIQYTFGHLLFAVLLICGIVLPCGEVNAQKYKEKITQDSIKISYKWRKDKKLKKESPYELMLQLENLSSSKVTVSFSLSFYWKDQFHSSFTLKEYCIKPQKKIKGKKWDLAFNASVFTQNQNLDPMFFWYIEDVEIKKNDSCNKRLWLKQEPVNP